MFKLSKLNEYPFEEKENCSHEYPDVITVADLMDRKNNFIRAHYCFKCGDYGWKEVKNERWNPEFLSRLRKEQNIVYSALDDIFTIKKLPAEDSK